MPRPRQTSDEQILEAARATFLAEGPSASTATIAESAGVSQALLFQRFGTKKQLLLTALLPSGPPPFIALLEAGPDARPLGEQMTELSMAIAHHLESVLPRFAVLAASGFAPQACFDKVNPSPPVMSHRAMSAWVERAQAAELIRPCDPKSLASAWLGSLHARAFASKVLGQALPGKSTDAYVADLIDLLTAGIAHEAQS